MAPKFKRRKINPPPSRRRGEDPVLATMKAKDAVATVKAKDALATVKAKEAPAKTKANDATPVKTSIVSGTQGSIVDIKIQQARNFAVAQAQKDGCTGNYKIFDSPFGNFLVPVVPSRAELAE